MTKCTPEFNDETRRLQKQLKDMRLIAKGAESGDFGTAIRAKAKELSQDESLSSQEVIDKTHEYINQYAPHTPEEVANKINGNDTYNKQRLTAVENQRQKIEGKIAAGDFSKDQRSGPREKTNAVLAAERELAASKHEIDRLRHQVELKNRSMPRKIADAALAAERFVILSGYHVLGKLAAYTAVELPAKILHGAVSEVWRHVPKVGDAFEKAPVHGGGFNWDAEKALYGALKDPEMRKAAWQRLTRGYSDWDAMYGEKADFQVIHPWLDFFGRLHNAIKTPTEFASMQRAKGLYDAQMIRDLKRQGLGDEEIMDRLSSPVVQSANYMKAYIRGKESVLKGDNAVVQGYRALIRTLKGKEGDSRARLGKGLAYFMESQIPIVKIPTNLVGRTIDYTPAGLAKAAIASKDLKNMSEAEAEYISDKLVHGTIGTAAIAAYWLYRDHFSGYYQPNDAKKGREPETLNGVKATQVLFHHPLTNLAQMVGTIGRIYDTTQGTPLAKLAVGTAKGGLGLLEQTPLSPLKGQEDAFRDSKSMGKWAGHEASTLIPGLVKDIAKDTDPAERRKAKTGTEVLKSNIPGLREELPRG